MITNSTNADCPIAVVLAGQPIDCTFARGHGGVHSWQTPGAPVFVIAGETRNRDGEDVADPLVIESIQGHLDAAASMLGCLPGNPRTDREIAERVHSLRPGVQAHHALAVIETLRAMGWRAPGA